MLIAALVTLLLAPADTYAKRTYHSRGYLIAVQLNRALAATPMRGTGYGLVEESRARGLNPALIAAIAGTESSYGAAACRSNRFNAFGLASCGSWSPALELGGRLYSKPPAFRRWREAYRFVALYLAERFPQARTPYDLRGYARCDSCWGRVTSGHMLSLGFPATVRWAW